MQNGLLLAIACSLRVKLCDILSQDGAEKIRAMKLTVEYLILLSRINSRAFRVNIKTLKVYPRLFTIISLIDFAMSHDLFSKNLIFSLKDCQAMKPIFNYRNKQ